MFLKKRSEEPIAPLKIKVTTPEGQAKKSEEKLRGFLLHGWVRKAKYETQFIDESSFLWIVYPKSLKERAKVMKSCSQFEVMMKKILGSKIMRKSLTKFMNADDLKELERHLQQDTMVEIVD